MQLETDTATLHVALHVADLDRSRAFYEELFGVPAAKVRPDYAKLELADPPLVLALNPVTAVDAPGKAAARLSHLGIRVGSPEALGAIRRRVEAAGLALRDEGETVCCYALQRKFWVADPDGNDWEFYELLEDAEELACGVDEKGATSSCCIPGETP